MSDKKRKRGRPRVAPLLSYTSEQQMRNNTPRSIKKPKYLQEIDEIKGYSRSSTPSRSIDDSSNHSRSSLNGSSRSQNFRGYNIGVEDKNSDYHYGSDFEEFSDVEKEKIGMDSGSNSDDSLSDIDSEFDEFDLGDQNLEPDNGGQSIHSPNFVPFWKLGPAGNLGYRPQTPVPVWLQERKYPPLNLPDSSDDLFMPRPFILQSIGIYEVLRHFKAIVRLSPFHFEDFCAALIVNEQSVLLTEIHIALIKALIREEDCQQTHFGQLDQKDSTNLSLCFVDSLTWPETLRIYLQSDMDFKHVLEIMDSCNYPFTSLSNRLKILQFLCDQFLQTTAAREDLLSEGKIKYDDHCRACHKTGDLLCCDSCPAVYHLDCADPPFSPSRIDIEDWICSICNKHNLEGVTDCLSLMEASGLMCRQEPIGYDRHGRKYWFLVRRIIVESENGEVWYYSTLEQLDLLLLLMDGKDLEEALYVALKEFGDDIRRQMELTETITEKARGDKISTISKESEECRKRIESLKEMRNKAKDDEMDTGKEGNDNMKLEGEEESKHELKKEDGLIDGASSSMAASQSSGNACKEEIKEEVEADDDDKKVFNDAGVPDDMDRIKKLWDNEAIEKMVSVKLEQLRGFDGNLYRLGCGYSYRSYCNQFSSNNLALSRQQYMEERDKKRHLSHKFSISNSPEFRWNGLCYGTKENQVSTVRQTILNLEQSVSSYFFHPHWQFVRKSWNQFVLNSTTPQHFAKALLWIVSCLKPSVFCNSWHESLGHIRLKKMTAVEREERKKQEKKEKKEADDESRYYPFIKFTKVIKHTLWKVKGEEYRIHGLWGWWWVSCLRKVNHIPMSKLGLRAGPTKITIPIKSQGNVIRGLPVIPSAYHQLAAKNPSMQFSLLSPKQRREELGDKTEHEGKEKQTNVATTGQFEVSTVNLEDHFEDGVINVSNELNARLRLVYPKLCKETSLDSFLSRRLALKIQEERDMEKNKKVVKDVLKDSEIGDKDVKVDVENDSDDTLSENSDSENIESIPDSQRRVVINRQRPAGHLLKEMRLHKFKYEALDKFDEFLPCYSPSCHKNGRGACYSPSCILKERARQKLVNSVNNYKIITNKPAPFDNVGSKSPVHLGDYDRRESEAAATDGGNKSNTTENTESGIPPAAPLTESNAANKEEDSSSMVTGPSYDESSNSSLSDPANLLSKEDRTFSNEDPSGKIYLKKCTDSKKVKKHRLPPLHLFRINGKLKMSSLFILPSWELKMLARKGGKCFPSGFNPNAKINSHFWPYPCARPVFKVTFLYRTTLVNTVNAVSHQLRILWSCLRWEDMQEKGSADGRKQITTDMEIIQTEVLKRKIFGRFLEKTEYLRRKVTIPLDVPKPIREFTPSQRSGLRKRRRAQSPINKQPESVEEWVEEERLDLWEIKYFGERLEKATSLSKKSSGLERGEGGIFNQVYRSTSPTDFRSKVEEHNKLQKASLMNSKNIISANKGVVKVSVSGTELGSPTNKINQKLVQGSSSIVTVGSKLPNVLSGKKIVTTKSGKIITVQTAAGGASTGNAGDGVTKIQLGKSSVIPISSLGKFQVSPHGNRIIRLQTVGSSGQRTILPRVGITDSTNLVRPINNPISTSQVLTSSPSPVRPQLQILKLPDGQLQIRGLQEGQQLLQRGDGKLTVVNTKLPSGQSPIQVAQTKIPENSKNTMIQGRNPLSTNQIVKINGQQVILRTPVSNPKQVTSLNAKDVLGSLSAAELKTLLDQSQGRQIFKTADSGGIQSPLSNTEKPSIIPFEEKTRASLPTPPASPSKTNSSTTTSSSSSNTMTLRVQARMTEQGPKTIIQGLQPGVGLTKDHLMAIQQQVHAMVAQYNLQVNELSPLMTLTLHVTNKNSQSAQQTASPKPTLVGDSNSKQLMHSPVPSDSYGHKVVDHQSKSDFAGLGNSASHIDNAQTVGNLVDLPKNNSNSKKSVGENAASTLSKGLKRLSDQYDESIDSDDLEHRQDYKKMKVDRPKGRRGEAVTAAASRTVSSPSSTTTRLPPNDAKKRVPKHQKLDGLLTKHKDLLKKDILKKRALLEKELQLQIHRDLTYAKQQMQNLEKIKGSEIGSQTAKKSKQESSKLSLSQSVTPLSSSLPSPKMRKVESMKSNTLTPPPLVATPKATKMSKKAIKQRSKKIVCICRTFFDDTKFYVGCDLCGNWFHGDCVGITEALSRSMTEYVCDDCANAKLNKDLFCFCRQPYDETQFYICCEKCEDWYHGKCVGIMQLEADDIDDYICPKCDPENQWNRPCQKKLTTKDLGEVKKVIKTLIQHKNAWPFLELVDKVEVPDYYKVVKKPMTLKMVESNVYEKSYKTLFEFIRDVMLVFDNCRAYNPPNSSFCTCANTLEIFFCSKLKQLKCKVAQ